MILLSEQEEKNHLFSAYLRFSKENLLIQDFTFLGRW